jgi:hypothetical protein
MFDRLFADEEKDLFKDMQSLPRNAALQKLNDLIQRAQLAKVIQNLVNSDYESAHCSSMLPPP